MDRRAFVKAMGVAGASLLVSMGLQSVGTKRVEAEKQFIPGAGGDLTPEEIDKIDSQAYISLCARCGICIRVCPFEAIRAKEVYYPTLTNTTLPKCPGYETCGVCLANCPPDALGMAFEPLGGTSGTERTKIWNGPTLRDERDITG